MQLSRDGYIMRLYLWGKEYRWRYVSRPSVDLCSLFWTCLWKAALATAGLIAAGFLVALFIVEVLAAGWWSALLPFTVLALAITGAAIIVMIFAGVGNVAMLISDTSTWQFIKGNYCPQIELKD